MNKKARLEKLNQIKKEAEVKNLAEKASDIARADTNAAAPDVETAANEYAERFTDAIIDQILAADLLKD